MVYIIHGARGSGSSIVEAACAEIGVEYEARDLDVKAEEHAGDAYTALNPHRKLPTLEIDGSEILTESAAILITLDERHRDAGLLPPPGSRPRAEALRWMLFLATELYPIVEVIDFPERFVPAGSRADSMRERAEQIWRDRWRLVERHVTGAPFFLASGFSAVDLYIAVLSRWDMKEDWRREHLGRIDAIAAAVRARPALAPIFDRHRLG